MFTLLVIGSGVKVWFRTLCPIQGSGRGAEPTQGQVLGLACRRNIRTPLNVFECGLNQQVSQSHLIWDLGTIQLIGQHYSSTPLTKCWISHSHNQFFCHQINFVTQSVRMTSVSYWSSPHLSGQGSQSWCWMEHISRQPEAHKCCVLEIKILFQTEWFIDEQVNWFQWTQ
jgi:hypothetical protein